MKKNILICTLFLVFACSPANSFRKISKITEKIEVKACLNKHANNLNFEATQEDGSCLFSYCPKKGYKEYEEVKDLEIQEYLKINGGNFSGTSRITDTCETKLFYCSHPDSLNYDEDSSGYHSEYCYFEACSNPEYKEFEKFTEFKQFLTTTQGEVAAKNELCKTQTVFRTSKTITPKITGAEFKGANINIVLDDSLSMRDEIDSMKVALINLAPVLKKINTNIAMNFYRLSEIHQFAVKTSDSPVIRNRFAYRFTHPLPFGSFSFSGSTLEEEIKNNIKGRLDNFKLKADFTKEEGLCSATRFLNDLKIENFNTDIKQLQILITDEDEHYRDSSKLCFDTFTSEKFPNEFLDNKEAFKSITGGPNYFDAIEKIVNSLSEKQKKSYGWLGIFYDKEKSTCSSAQGAHGQNYVKFLNRLEKLGLQGVFGDICSEDYTGLINDKLIEEFLTKIETKYFIKSHDGRLVITSIFWQSTGQRISESKYRLIEKNAEYFIEFLDKEILKLNQDNIKINYTYHL